MSKGHAEAMRSECNSMTYWFPRLLDAGFGDMVPKTVFAPFDQLEYLREDGESTAQLWDLAGRLLEIREDMTKGGELPLFMRTDQYSGKHDWETSCYLAPGPLSRDHIAGRLHEWVEEHDGMFGPWYFKGIYLREFLTLRASFKAFRGMPIAREFRFFANPERVTHWQPYWPPASIESGYHYQPRPENWRQLLRELSELSDKERFWLEGIAVSAARAQDGQEYSVDLCQDTAGKWWLTDMALGCVSYRWDPKTGADNMDDFSIKFEGEPAALETVGQEKSATDNE